MWTVEGGSVAERQVETRTMRLLGMSPMRILGTSLNFRVMEMFSCRAASWIPPVTLQYITCSIISPERPSNVTTSSFWPPTMIEVFFGVETAKP